MKWRRRKEIYPKPHLPCLPPGDLCNDGESLERYIGEDEGGAAAGLTVTSLLTLAAVAIVLAVEQGFWGIAN